jgi:hypothetical protein
VLWRFGIYLHSTTVYWGDTPSIGLYIIIFHSGFGSLIFFRLSIPLYYYPSGLVEVDHCAIQIGDRYYTTGVVKSGIPDGLFLDLQEVEVYKILG